MKAKGLSAGMTLAMGALFIGPLRSVAGRLGTQPGDGPSREAIENGHFRSRVFGKRDGEVVVTGTVTGTQDPGYGATACMLADTGLALALAPQLGEAGVVTPASALGQILVDRLQPHRVQFTAEGC